MTWSVQCREMYRKWKWMDRKEKGLLWLIHSNCCSKGIRIRFRKQDDNFRNSEELLDCFPVFV